MTDAVRVRELMLGNLFAVFNERDAERRLKAIADHYTEDVIWSDPAGTATAPAPRPSPDRVRFDLGHLNRQERKK